jgi:hypothetical protein
MRKRLLLAFGLVACLGLAALVAWHLWPPKPGVTEANFHRLRVGMSEEEVGAVLGGPGEFVCAMTCSHFQYWEGGHCRVGIRFSDVGGDGVSAESGGLTTDDGRTVDLPPEPTPFFEQLRRSLPW